MAQGFFCDCTNLDEIELPETIQNIEEYAFYNCTNLKKVIIPQSITSISRFAFNNCPELTIYGQKKFIRTLLCKEK